MFGAKVYTRAHELSKAINKGKLHQESVSVTRKGKTFQQKVWKRGDEDTSKHAAETKLPQGGTAYKPTVAGALLGNLNSRRTASEYGGRVGNMTMSEEDDNSAKLHYTIDGRARTRYITGFKTKAKALAQDIMDGIKAELRTQAGKVSLDDAKVKAGELGARAHAAGKKAVPMHDAELMKLIEQSGAGKEVGGGSSDIMAAWIDAWHQANLDADAKKPVDKTNKQPETGLMHKFTAEEKADLINAWHTMKGIMYETGKTRHDRLIATARGFAKEHPHISENAAYKRLTQLLDPHSADASAGTHKDDEGAVKQSSAPAKSESKTVNVTPDADEGKLFTKIHLSTKGA